MSVETWLAFCVTEAVLAFVPGPAVLFVVSVALARGQRAGLAGALGILAGNTLYFGLSATGVAAVIVASGELFTAIQWTGAAYLIWTGIAMLRTPPQGLAAVAPQPVARSFVRGFVVQAANPKAILFFVALVPQFIDPGEPLAAQILLLGASSVAIELAVLALYTALAARARRAVDTRFATALERVGGGFLIAAGARLAMVRSE